MSANHTGREPMSTGKGLSATETKAYARGVAAAKREREDALTTIIRELEAERDALKAQVKELVEALRELHGMYALTWDRVDGALVMMDKGIPRFEEAHEKARAMLAKAAK